MSDNQDLIKKLLDLQKQLENQRLGIAKQGETPEETQALEMPTEAKLRDEIQKKINEIKLKNKG